MEKRKIEQLLEGVKLGSISMQQALESLVSLPYEDVGFAKLDTHRSLRTGFPEVVFCQGKTAEQTVRIVSALTQNHDRIIATRITPEVAREVVATIPEATHYPVARMVVIDKGNHGKTSRTKKGKYIMVLTGGTADIPVAEEAAITAETMGSRVERSYDVGVAGLHRVLSQRERIMGANALVVVAGMEGALPSIIGGMVAKPVIAVPTSVGYGANFGGLSALLAMLNSCAAGVTVVNIDNGFGAGYFAHLVNK